MTATNRTGRTLAGLGLLALVLAGCASTPPEVVTPPPPAVVPAALTVDQTDSVLTDLGTVLADGDEELDADALTPRIEGPALEMRTAEYVRSSATDGDKPPTELPTEALASVVPQTTDWARTQLVVTEQPDDLQAQRILILRQDDARAPYRMWGWTRLMPGAQMPATAPADEGSPVVAADDDSTLLFAPEDALKMFVSTLKSGDDSEFADDFTASPYQDEIADLHEQAEDSIGEAGTATASYSPPVLGTALQTIDGGAVVAGAFTTTSTIDITLDGATIPLSDDFLASLAGATSVSESLERTYRGVVVLYVPPAGSDATIQVLAGELVLTTAEAE
ncbi:hypothetical protein KIN34_00010 [Cellulomonas sp. DKR-3]|uniref:DUF8094 domain-containing protein n=1 Tax=Cellulomonas fulva TaxID=2835530 RepID=A0ABS5TU70_9CELL|nr:hypothetical protein [Cellulomonas fulva]MBT0992675.1 hypothetical protein [Cellulomonas fulva]